MTPSTHFEDLGPLYTSEHSQTLSRGLQLLEILSNASARLSINELATASGFHRSITYRLLRTLEDHQLVSRGHDGLYELGIGLVALARGVQHDLQTVAVPEMSALANQFGTMALLVVWDHASCITLATVEPRDTPAALVQHSGTRHGFATGAPGLAIQSAITEQQWNAMNQEDPYRPEAWEAADQGFAVSRNEVIEGVCSVAAPIHLHALDGYMYPASVGLVFLDSMFTDDDVQKLLGPRVQEAAKRIERELGVSV
ncbi:IclR family transcriptional regulator [Micrococcoides hystricis]|uniref:IclR family transcriptional regulator n=1 Tax=Micrococcoides hystricis TaxID=1572761 RepID=A0ABV6PDZ4_9MICC